MEFGNLDDKFTILRSCKIECSLNEMLAIRDLKANNNTKADSRSEKNCFVITAIDSKWSPFHVTFHICHHEHITIDLFLKHELNFAFGSTKPEDLVMLFSIDTYVWMKSKKDQNG